MSSSSQIANDAFLSAARSADKNENDKTRVIANEFFEHVLQTDTVASEDLIQQYYRSDETTNTNFINQINREISNISISSSSNETNQQKTGTTSSSSNENKKDDYTNDQNYASNAPRSRSKKK